MPVAEEEPAPQEQLGTTTQALVGTADFDVPQVGYWCSAIWPTAGWTLNVGAPGDENANPCANAINATTIRTGMYSATGTNIAEVWCDPNHYWVYQGQGRAPIDAAYQAAASTTTSGNCLFKVTVGNAIRTAPPNYRAFALPTQERLPLPAANAFYTFDADDFVASLEQDFAAANPVPVGYQIAVRDPNGFIVRSVAHGTNELDKPSAVMVTGRRFDMASASKTITATAMVAALEDLAKRKPGEPAMPVGLDTPIRAFLPSNWTIAPSAQNITFRMVLEHRSGFCGVHPGGDRFSDVKAMLETGAKTEWKGEDHYCNANYSLLRILIPYVVDGPAAYQPYENIPTVIDIMTALSYRNYVRGRLFGPLGLGSADLFHTGAAKETLYFNLDANGGYQTIPNGLSIPGVGYDMRPNQMILTAGSGNWTLSAEEMSFFISSLWRGKIVSNASLSQMIAQVPGTGVGVGAANYSTTMVLSDGTKRVNISTSGAGGANAPVSQWMTFFNGYSAVFHLNSPWGVPGATWQAMQRAAIAATRSRLR